MLLFKTYVLITASGIASLLLASVIAALIFGLAADRAGRAKVEQAVNELQAENNSSSNPCLGASLGSDYKALNEFTVEELKRMIRRNPTDCIVPARD